MDLIDPADITVECWPPRKVGGQVAGVPPSGVKVTHIPSGIVICVCAERSQARNRWIAMDALEGALTSPHYRG